MNAHVRHFTRLALAAAAVASLSACASMDDDRYGAAAGAGAIEEMSYVEAVEELASKRGVKVVWVNPPTPGPEAE